MAAFLTVNLGVVFVRYDATVIGRQLELLSVQPPSEGGAGPSSPCAATHMERLAGVNLLRQLADGHRLWRDVDPQAHGGLNVTAVAVAVAAAVVITGSTGEPVPGILPAHMGQQQGIPHPALGVQILAQLVVRSCLVIPAGVNEEGVAIPGDSRRWPPALGHAEECGRLAGIQWADQLAVHHLLVVVVDPGSRARNRRIKTRLITVYE